MQTFNLTLLSSIIALIFNSNKINAQACISFQDTTLSLTIPTTQANYGSPWYSNSGVSFTSKYFDYAMMGLPGEVDINDHVTSGYTGSNGSSNYVSNIFYQGNVITQIDFSALAITSKQIEFDVNGINNNGSANPYYVNGSPLNTLPSGITYLATPLTNGYHITLTGNINTIEIHGFEVGVDNLCVDSLITNPPSSGCLDLNASTLTDSPANYNNDSIYPIGSPSITAGDIQVIKPKTGAWMPFFEQSTINQITPTNILYHGYITFDVSKSTYSCKELTIIGFANEIIIGTDTISTAPGFNPYNGNGYSIDTVSGGYIVSGSFNAVTLFAQTSIYSSVCLQDCSINTSPCIDFNDTNLVVGNIPTNDTTYNSVDYSSQGVDFSVKYEDHTGSWPPLQGSYQIKDSTGGWSHIFDMHPNFSGSMWWLGNVAVKIDLNNISYTNKKVTFDISNQGTSSLFLLQNPFRVNGMNENTLPAGVTYSYNYVGLAANGDSSYQVEINGPITTLEWYGFEVGFDNLCVDSATIPCTNYAGFTFTVTGNAVQFINTSSVNSTNADQFIWDFGDGNNSGDNDPLHTYPGPGTYYVCLTIVDFSCPTNPIFQYCDSVVIGNCPNGHRIITPNNDGQADEVFIPKGSKIFDRNGFMVREIKQDMNWKGRDDSNQILPMGYYTITCGNGGEIFNITIIR